LISNHQFYLRKSFALAQKAIQNGNHPFGAILVISDQIVMEIENTVLTENDVTRHAELNLISQATRTYSAEQLKHSILYTSTEPCAMCSGAVYWAGIRHVVYGCSATTLGKHSNGSFMVSCRSVFQHARENVQVEGPLLEDEASLVHANFWKHLLKC
jgi:tRNA(Arg) A34 adenosine deaminase TadA